MANTDSADNEPVKKQVAVHQYVDSAKAIVENEEDAKGIRYELLGVNEPFIWLWDEANELERMMLAIFGAKTLSTNESSAVRNNPKIKGTSEASPENQMAAVLERFQLLRDGQWVDRTREPGAVRIDKDALAEAICLVLIAKQKKTREDCDTGYKATVRQRLEDDREFVKKSRQVPEIAAQYAALVGKAAVTVDDLFTD